MKTTIDENGKFNYVSADMRPVPPGIQFCEIYWDKFWNIFWEMFKENFVII